MTIPLHRTFYLVFFWLLQSHDDDMHMGIFDSTVMNDETVPVEDKNLCCDLHLSSVMLILVDTCASP